MLTPTNIFWPIYIIIWQQWDLLRTILFFHTSRSFGFGRSRKQLHCINHKFLLVKLLILRMLRTQEQKPQRETQLLQNLIWTVANEGLLVLRKTCKELILSAFFCLLVNQLQKGMHVGHGYKVLGTENRSTKEAYYNYTSKYLIARY